MKTCNLLSMNFHINAIDDTSFWDLINSCEWYDKREYDMEMCEMNMDTLTGD